MWLAVAWAGLVQLGWRLGWSPGWDQWFDSLRSLPAIGSPVVILLFVARREGRISSDHQHRHDQLQNLELQLRSWEPYLQTLPDSVRDDLVAQITPKLFVGDVAVSQSENVKAGR